MFAARQGRRCRTGERQKETTRARPTSNLSNPFFSGARTSETANANKLLGRNQPRLFGLNVKTSMPRGLGHDRGVCLVRRYRTRALALLLFQLGFNIAAARVSVSFFPRWATRASYARSHGVRTLMRRYCITYPPPHLGFYNSDGIGIYVIDVRGSPAAV